MAAILQQLGLDSTFYTQLAIFFVLFVFLSQVFFKPFLALFEERHRRTVADREAAQTMVASAQAKIEEYEARIREARAQIRKDLEENLLAAKAEESQILSAARAEAKKLTLEAVASVEAERARVKTQLERDAESLAAAIAETLLSRKA